MADFEKLFQLGEKLGYSGESLRSFIAEQQEKEEKERLQEIEREDKLRKEEQEREDKLRKEKHEREDIRRQQEREIEKEIELARLEFEKSEHSTNTNESMETNTPRIKFPKMPMFSDETDDMDAYIYRFETQTNEVGWDDKEKFKALSNLLSGEALKVFYTLSNTEHNYDALKKALFKRYRFTEEGYQDRFRTAVPEMNEAISTFISRLEITFNGWLELAEIQDGDFKSLKELMIKDQIYRSVNEDMVAFLKISKPDTLLDLRKIADRYESAHPNKPMQRQSSIMNVALSKHTVSHEECTQTNFYENMRSEDEYYNMRIEDTYNNMRNDEQCQSEFRSERQFDETSDEFQSPAHNEYFHQRKYYKKPRYHARNRWKHNECYDEQWTSWNYYKSKQPRNNNGFRRKFNRGSKPYPTYSNGTTYSPKYYANGVQITEKTSEKPIEKPTEEPVYKITAMTCGNDQVPTFKGKINEQPCSVSRSTGSNCIDVQESKLDPSDCVDSRHEMTQFGDSIQSCRIDRRYLETPLLTEIKTLHFNDKHDVPKEDGHTNTNNGDGTEKDQYNRPQCYDQQIQNERQSDNQQNLMNKTTTKDNQQDKILNISYETFLSEQREDTDLMKMKNKPNGRTKYIVKNELLHRVSKKQNIPDQIVLPRTLRIKVIKACHTVSKSNHRGSEDTIRKIAYKYSWPGMFKDIRKYVRCCQRCENKIRCSKERPRVVNQSNIKSRSEHDFHIINLDASEKPESEQIGKFEAMTRERYERNNESNKEMEDMKERNIELNKQIREIKCQIDFLLNGKGWIERKFYDLEDDFRIYKRLDELKNVPC